jgi:exosortase A-associated hydrolase 1
MNAYREQGVVFKSGFNRLVGIAAIPEVATDVGVLILVGGPQYRVGSHRQFTLLARSLAEAGFASLRFDYTGMGDSEGGEQEFDKTKEDISAAIDALFETIPGISRVVLWGLCDAASSAMIFAYSHERVTGMILLNPWVHKGEYSLDVKMAHFYAPSIFNKDQWRRLLSGKIKLIPSIKELAADTLALIGKRSSGISRQTSRRSYVDNMLDGLQRFHHDILIVLSEADLTAREFSTVIAQEADWKEAISRPTITVKTVLGADHTFSQRSWREQVSQMTIDWLRR